MLPSTQATPVTIDSLADPVPIDSPATSSAGTTTVKSYRVARSPRNRITRKANPTPPTGTMDANRQTLAAIEPNEWQQVIQTVADPKGRSVFDISSISPPATLSHSKSRNCYGIV